MRGYGDSDKPAGTDGYDARALAGEFRALVRQIGFGYGKPLLLAAHDMSAHPALRWAADHPEEVSGLLYMEAPTMLSEVLTKIIAYTPEAMKSGSMWWILPLAPSVPERFIVGNERAFLTWFYDGATAECASIEPTAIEETLRTFCGNGGVLAAFGGDKALGAGVQEMAALVAENITGGVVTNCGHFIPEERPDEVVRQIQAMMASSPSLDREPAVRVGRGSRRRYGRQILTPSRGRSH